MAASAQVAFSVVPRSGVVTLFGYSIRVHVDRGHLILEDGIGTKRHSWRLPRVGHGLERLVVIGSDGMISLAALRWLSDQGVAFVMLERNGTVLAATGAIRQSDAQLRRAQACANQSDIAVHISRELIGLKLASQETMARDKLRDISAADAIAQLRAQLSTARTTDAVRVCEARAAAAYWTAWRTVQVEFPKKDLHRIPEHWKSFGSRTSPISGFSPRLAANPLNAILNYLYAVLESEARLAANAVGLDPGIGFLHLDHDKRSSLACDLMEPVRPDVDAFLFDWVSSKPFSREWFFEQRDGTCRLMGSFAVRLSETGPTWRHALAPLVEWVCQTLWSSSAKSASRKTLSTPLTQSRKREAQGRRSLIRPPTPAPQNVCRECGATIMHSGIYCRLCSIKVTKAKFAKAAESGRAASLSREAQARRVATQQRNAGEMRGWIAANQPSWLHHEAYVTRIQPLLAGLPVSTIAAGIGVSQGYASDIRKGKVHPHPRHWLKLAGIVGVSGV